MTRLQKMQLRQSEIRQQIAGLLDTPDDKRTETYQDDLSKLTKEARAVEGELQAAIVAGDESKETVKTETPEGRELRELVDGANVGEIFNAALERRNIDGPTRELQEHYHLGPNQVPLDLLMEERAITPAPGNVGQEQQTIIPYVFPMSVAAFLGIPQPRVPVGEVVYPVLTSELTVGTPAESAEQAETTGAFSAEVLSPGRIQASFFYSREDSARFAGMDAALRMNLAEGLENGLDKVILSGTNGLLTGTNLPNHNVTAVTDFAGYVTNFGYARVDGRYADSAGALRIVVGSGTYAHMGGVYRATESDRTALDRLMEVTGGVRVSAHVPAASGTPAKQNAVIRLGMRMDAVAAIWEGVTLIPDEVTGAKKGEITITAVMLHAVKILRAAGFYKQQSQHA